jgi:hypothetical protein
MFAKDIELLNEIYKQKITEMNIGPNGDNDSVQPSVSKINRIVMPQDNCNKCNSGVGEEDCENMPNHEDTNAGMVRQSLFRLVKLSAMLHDLVAKHGSAEPWVLSKITEALNHVESVYGYMDYENYRQQVDTDIENIEEETEQDLYNTIAGGGETIINKLRAVLSTESREQVEEFIYEAITALEKQ